MMRIAINGFGRIGRGVLRILSERSDMEVVAINDLFETEALAYLFQFDTVRGPFSRPVQAASDSITVDGQRIQKFAIKDPAELPWAELKVDAVIESTGIFRQRADLEKHLAAGAQRVLLTVPPKDEIDAMVVMGVNDENLKREHRLVSNASCTANCLAPLAKILDDAFTIEHGIMTTVHAYTNDQRLADVAHKDLRRSRAAAENIIPTTTGAAKAVGKVLPHLQGKLDGMAVRVPVADGSVVDLVVKLARKPSPQEINQAVAKAAQESLSKIVEYSEHPLVSSDIIGNAHSSIVDSQMTQSLSDGYCRVLSWYDNEWGYSNRCVDLLAKLGTLR